MNENVKKPEVLLVEEKGSKQLSAVTGINTDGTPKTTPAKQAQEPEFLKINQNADALENFMSNFLSQCKNPTHFQFFKLPLEGLDKSAPVLQEMLKNPDNPSNKALLDQHRVIPDEIAPKQEQAQQNQSAQKNEYQPMDESQINWNEFKQIGIIRDMLVATGSLEPMLNYQKSPVLLPIQVDVAGSSFETQARLALRRAEDGSISLAIHPIKKEIELEGMFYGNPLSQQVKENLLKTGHAGELVDIKVKDESVKTFVSVDKLTNELVAVRADKVKIPTELLGVTLSARQQDDLLNGKSVAVESMVSKNTG